MKKSLSVLLLFVLVSLAYLAGRHHASVRSGASTSARQILYYVDPMHPSYKSDKPGIAPDCGMQLEPMYADDASTNASAMVDRGSLPPGVVKINLEQQQLIGIRTEEVARKSGSARMTVPGRVVPDDTRTYRLTAGTDGIVLDTFDHGAGSFVKKQEVLATFGSPEFLTAESTFLANWNRAPENKYEWSSPKEWKDWTLKQSVTRLRTLGMSESQIKELTATKQAADSIQIDSPVNGVILLRGITAGQRVVNGAEFYRIADLSRVWIMASMHEDDVRTLHPGTEVKLTIPNAERSWRARVSDALSQVDPATRTLQVRLETENPGLLLRPDMFVNVEFAAEFPDALTVPLDALLDAGLAKRVFVDRENGAFEPRKVETGRYFGNRVEIVSGLNPGERVVVSGNFLLDSESRLRAPQGSAIVSPRPTNEAHDARLSKAVKMATDPACGMEVDPAKSIASGNTDSYNGTTYYFCSRSCRDTFHKAPQTYPAAGSDQHSQAPASIKDGRGEPGD